MKVCLLLAGVSLCLLLILPGALQAGYYFPPPGDDFPVWSADGSRIAFFTQRGGSPNLRVVTTRFEEEALSPLDPWPGPYGYGLSPDWRWLAFYRHLGSDDYELTVSRVDGSQARSLANAGAGAAPDSFGTRPTWSPDGGRIAFRGPDGELDVVGFDGSGFVRIASKGETPAWSPDGTRIAYARMLPDPEIHIVGADGKNDVVVRSGAGAQFDPRWSPDGTRIAYLSQPAHGAAFGLSVARLDGSERRDYLGPGASGLGQFSWDPDGRSLVFARNVLEGLYRLDLATGKSRRLTSFGGTPVVSPDGTHIAFAAGGECRDRVGIYVLRSDGTESSRVTHDCRILGTDHDDILRGTALADILVGLAGDDRLVAADPYYMGDTLLGGDGNDVLVGGWRGEILRGGRGDDTLKAGNSGDWLYGGPGHDRLSGGRGNDFLYARDGSRDVISCGTNRVWRRSEQDEVWADRFDRVSPDCEVVYRAG